MAGVLRQVADAHPGADHRRLVADRVHAAQQVDPGAGVAHVEVVGARRRLGRAVRHRQHEVDPDHLVAVLLEHLADGGADEAGRAGEQDPHGPPTSGTA